MDRIWLASYPPGIPHEIEPGRYASLAHFAAEICERYATLPAFDSFGSRLRYAEVARHADAFAAWLTGVAGVRAGERVALMMPNMLAYPVCLLGALAAGAVVVNTNPQYTHRELAHQLADSGARVLVVFAGALGTVAELGAEERPEHIVVCELGDFMAWPKAWLVNRAVRRRLGTRPALPAGATRLPRALAAGRARGFTRPSLGPDDLAFLQYTGGTTGRAKAAMLSHGNVLANILQVVAWFGDRSTRGAEVVVTALPLYHVYALTANCLAFMHEGGLNCLVTDPRNIDGLIGELKRVRFTSITGVNTLFNALLDHPRFAGLDFSALKVTNAGGTALQRTVAERWQAVTGCAIAEGYGLTEASPVVAVNRLDQPRPGIGLPLPSTEVCIVDDAGRPLPPGERGELWVRGPQVMRGYWNAPEETRAVLDGDGWLHTGDIAVMAPDGHLTIVDRKKELILVSGFNVYPNEVEDVAAACPGVREVAAIAVADARSGEAVRLVVVRSDPSLDAETLVVHCRGELAGYKVPRSVVFVDALPKSPVGKILRREVRLRHGA